MGSKGSNTIQTSQTYTANPAVGGAANLALSKATEAANQPFQLPVAPVAGLTPDQQAAFEGVRGAQGMTAPYFDAARGFVTQSAAPVTGAEVQNYYNPFAKNVFDNLAETFGRQTRDVTGRLTNAAGGVGADRIAVGQAELARQQGLAAGQTAANLYLPALQAAQQDKQRQAQAGFAMGALGPAAQAAELQGSGALLNIGGLQQQQRQAELMAPYQHEVARQAYPFQTAQFLSGITGGLAPSLGGTTTGQQTGPKPSMLSQVLGAGLGITGMFGQMGGFGGFGGFGGGMGKGSGGYSPSYMGGADPSGMLIYGPGFRRGGVVRRDNGGAIPDIVPDVELRPGPFPMPIPMPSGGGGAGGGSPSGGTAGKDQPEWMKYAAMAAKFAPMLFGAPPIPMGAGGRARNFDGYNPFASGGAVEPMDAGTGFAEGGTIDLVPGPDGAFSFNDRFQPAVDAVQAGIFDPQGANFTTGQPFLPMPRPRPAMASAEPGFMPSQTQPVAQPYAPAPMAYTEGVDSPENASTADFGANDESGLMAPQPDRATDFARSPWAALTAAGFGMMAGTSPFAGVNIGKGALEGTKVLERQRQLGTQERRVDLEAKRLMQQAQQFLKGHGLKERQLDESIRQHNWQSMQPVKIGMDEIGRDVYALRDPRTGRYVRIDPKTGQPWQSSAVTQTEVPAVQAPAADAALPPGAQPAASEIPKHIRAEILDTLEPQIANQVKALAEGRMPFPSGQALRTPYWQNMMRLVTQYDPSFDAVNYNARATTRRNFATGVEARNITALNTVMGHLDTLDKAGDALDNFRSNSFGPGSKAMNEMRRWYLSNKQDPRVKNFETAAEAVANELERAFRGSTTAIAGIRSWREKMNPAMSPEEMKEANKTLTKLLASRIDAMGDQYSRGMGTTKDPLTLLSPDAQATFNRLAKGEKAPAGAPKLSDADRQALDWAKTNPNDPRAAAIKKRLGVP